MGVLRLFLAVSVLVTHLRFGRGLFGFSFLGGGLAVECFFIISGFYMALVLNEKYNYGGSYWAFIRQRYLRLYPLYLVVAILIVVTEGIISFASSQPCGIYAEWSRYPQCLTVSSLAYYVLVNLTILGQDTLWFLCQDNVTGQLYLNPGPIPNATQCINYILNGPTWTLGVEMTFYLLAPFLVRRSISAQAAYALCSLVLRSVFYWSLAPKISTFWTYSFSPSVLFFFMAGSIGYQFYKSHGVEMQKFAARHVWIFWIIGIVMLVQGRTPLKDYFFWIFVPVAIWLVPMLFALTRNNKRDRLIGELSYPYYLIHAQWSLSPSFFSTRTTIRFSGRSARSRLLPWPTCSTEWSKSGRNDSANISLKRSWRHGIYRHHPCPARPGKARLRIAPQLLRPPQSAPRPVSQDRREANSRSPWQKCSAASAEAAASSRPAPRRGTRTSSL